MSNHTWQVSCISNYKRSYELGEQMRQLTLLILAFAITTTTFVNDAEARRSRRPSISQQQYAQAFAQAEAQREQAQAIPSSPYTNVCEVFINFRSRPDVVVSGLTSLAQPECNNLKLDTSGVPFGGFNSDFITDLITPRYFDGTGLVYSGNYLGIGLNSAYEVVTVSNQLLSHPSVQPQLFFLHADVRVARGIWR